MENVINIKTLTKIKENDKAMKASASSVEEAEKTNIKDLSGKIHEKGNKLKQTLEKVFQKTIGKDITLENQKDENQQDSSERE